MHKEQIEQLLDRYLRHECTAEEEQLVENWLQQNQQANNEWQQMKEADKKQWINHLFASIQQSAGINAVPSLPAKGHNIQRFKRIAIAASIIATIGIAAHFAVLSLQTKHAGNLAGLSQTERYKNDINPAAEGVVLKLADGKELRLDSMHNGTITTDGSLQVQKNIGSLAYTKASEVYHHTIATNKGMDYHLTLADGTQVWLDAMSSIHFPTSFPGNERVVEVTGQAYFEVAKNAAKPFKVKTGTQTVEVLGTHFNINAHDAAIKTTLLEGSVRVSTFNGQRSTVIQPGEQARVAVDGGLSTVDGIDLDETMAWKNGRFYFTGTTIEELMAQLQRWYNIDVRFADKIENVLLVAKINRNESISKILSLLEMTKQIQFVIEGNKVTVMKAK